MRGTLAASDAGVGSDGHPHRGEFGPLPYVARLARNEKDLLPHSPATSIGIDLGIKLAGWSSRVMDTLTFELNDSGRAAVIRDHRQRARARPVGRRSFPRERRTGGRVYWPHRDDDGRQMGVFASRESIQLLLRQSTTLTAVIQAGRNSRSGRSAAVRFWREFAATAERSRSSRTRRSRVDRACKSRKMISVRNRQSTKPGGEYQTRGAGVSHPADERLTIAGSRRRCRAGKPSSTGCRRKPRRPQRMPRGSFSASGGRNVRSHEGQRTQPSQRPTGASSSTRQCGQG